MSKPQISTRAELMPSSPIRKLFPLAEAAEQRGIKIYKLNIGQRVYRITAPSSFTVAPSPSVKKGRK